MDKFGSWIKADLCKFKGAEAFKVKHWLSLFNPRVWPVSLFRLSHLCYRCKLGLLAKFVSLLNQMMFGCDIARRAKIEGGLYLPHPCGVVIGKHVVIGKDCIVHQGVSLGARGEDHELSNPTVKDCVEIGTGAKVLGKITVGNYARIGANAVVLNDVPDKAVAVGIPAKIKGYRDDIS